MNRNKMPSVRAGVHKHEKALHPGKPTTPMAKGGRACMAAGGAAKVRHNQATPSGTPKAAPKRHTQSLI